MRTTERGLLANRSRLSQHMQVNGRFVVSLFRCIYLTAKFILCSTACYCRDQAAKLVTSHAHSHKLITPVNIASVFQSIFASSPVQSSPESRFCTVPFTCISRLLQKHLQLAQVNILIIDNIWLQLIIF